MPLLPRSGSTARQRVLAQRLRLQVRLEKTAEGQLNRALQQTVAAMFTDQVLDTADVDTALASFNRKISQLLTTIWRVSMHSTAEHVFIDLEDLRKGAGAQLEQKARTAEQRFSKRVAQWIENNGGQRIVAISERTRKEAVQTIAEGRSKNQTIDEIRRALEESPGFSRTRAAVIARTEVHTAGSAASDLAALEVQQETGAAMKREWISAEDDRTRSAHAEADGQVRGFDEAFQFTDDDGSYSLMQPGDPSGPPRGTINCFLPGTMVSGAFVAGLKARYAGPARELKTGRGHRLRVTAKHPVLTARGWVLAHQLREGDKLLSCSGNVESPAPRHEKHQHGEASIEHVFKALGADAAPRLQVVGALDLHGDGRFVREQVHVVFPDRRLGLIFQAGRSGSAQQLPLVASLPSLREGVAPRAEFLLAVGHEAAAARSPSLRALAPDAAPIALHDRPLLSLSFGPAAQWHTTLGQASGQGLAGHAEFIGELLAAAAGDITLDDLVEIRDFDFAGHVYDLQAVDGWLMASGIIASNCRCAIGYVAQ